MAYLRWDTSVWYVYADVRGGLTIHHAERSRNGQNLSEETVTAIVNGDLEFSEITGWEQERDDSRNELREALAAYLVDELE